MGSAHALCRCNYQEKIRHFLLQRVLAIATGTARSASRGATAARWSVVRLGGSAVGLGWSAVSPSQRVVILHQGVVGNQADLVRHQIVDTLAVQYRIRWTELRNHTVYQSAVGQLNVTYCMSDDEADAQSAKPQQFHVITLSQVLLDIVGIAVQHSQHISRRSSTLSGNLFGHLSGVQQSITHGTNSINFLPFSVAHGNNLGDGLVSFTHTSCPSSVWDLVFTQAVQLRPTDEGYYLRTAWQNYESEQAKSSSFKSVQKLF